MSKPIKLTEFLDRAPIQFLECRALQHSWDSNKGDVVRDGARIEWTLPCDRCGAKKTFVLNRKGQIIKSSRYSYAKGYSIEGGTSKQVRGVIRLTLLEVLEDD